MFYCHALMLCLCLQDFIKTNLMKKNNLLVVLLIVAAGLVACSKNGGSPPAETKPAVTPVGTNDGTAVTQTIGSAGGTVISDDGEIELIIPSGALTSNTAITIQPITNNAPNGRGKAYRCTPDGQQFAKDITIKFHYTEEDAAATNPDYMLMAFQTADRNWQIIDHVTNDILNKTISAQVNHFTDFTAFDIMRIEPGARYLKPNETGEYVVATTGMSQLNNVQLITNLLESEITWKVNGVTGGNSANGTITANITRGNYKAPATAPAVNPVTISAEVNFPFVVDGQPFNRGIVTANAFIVGQKYGVKIEASLEQGLGTLEKYRISDVVTFNVNLMGLTGEINNIQNSPPTFTRIQSSTSCVSTVVLSGTGILHLRPQDTHYVTAYNGNVIISFGQGGGFVNPKMEFNCQGNTPAINEIPIAGHYVGKVEYLDNGQAQSYTENTPPFSYTVTITPLQ